MKAKARSQRQTPCHIPNRRHLSFWNLPSTSDSAQSLEFHLNLEREKEKPRAKALCSSPRVLRGLLPAPWRKRTFTRTVTQENRSPKGGRLPRRWAAGSVSSFALPHTETPRLCAFWSQGAGKPELEGLGPCQVPRHLPSLSEDRLAVWASHQIHKPHPWAVVTCEDHMVISASCAGLHSSLPPPFHSHCLPPRRPASSLPAAFPKVSSDIHTDRIIFLTYQQDQMTPLLKELERNLCLCLSCPMIHPEHLEHGRPLEGTQSTST